MTDISRMPSSRGPGRDTDPYTSAGPSLRTSDDIPNRLLRTVTRLKSSIFTKMLLIFLLGLIVYSYSMKMIHTRYIRDAKLPEIQRFAVTLAGYIINETGIPPDTAMARHITDSLGIGLSFEHGGKIWKTNPRVPRPADPVLPLYAADGSIVSGFDQGLMVGMHTDSGSVLIVFNDQEDELLQAAESTMLLSALVTIIVMLFMYAGVRYLLRPLKILHGGVESLSSGNISFEIETKRTDELGLLIKSFSSMVKKIREMLEARDRLLLDVSHELRSPLTRIKLSLAMMTECPERSEVTADIHEMETMITEILETERMASPHGKQAFADVDVHAVLKDCAAELGSIQPGVVIGSLPDVSVRGNRKQLKILFSNLIKNSLKYSPKEAKPVRIEMTAAAGSLQVVISDTGEGIPAEDMPYIFEPFYRVDKSRARSSGGYGLGLSLAKRIAEVHGGDVVLHSKAGEGVRAVVVLPCKPLQESAGRRVHCF